MKISLLVIMSILLISGCAFDTFDMYKDEIHELLRNPKSRKMQGGENDINNLDNCPILFSLEKWQFNDRWKSWYRYNTWYKGSIVSHKNFGLYSGRIDKSSLSSTILKNTKNHPVYIGPWHYSPKIKKNIRFFAYQDKEGGPIRYHYESMTEENKKIKEKPFSLSPSSKYAPDKFSLCVVKWTAKFGYNAVIDLRENPWFPIFSNKYLIGSGKMIEAEE